eukprot:3223587-Prorocentrum_lima.AAC.1
MSRWSHNPGVLSNAVAEPRSQSWTQRVNGRSSRPKARSSRSMPISSEASESGAYRTDFVAKRCVDVVPPRYTCCSAT